MWSMTGIWGIFLAVAGLLASMLLMIFRDLRKRWIKRITDRLDHALQRSVSRFGGKYREFVLNNLRYIDVKGLATTGPYTPELDEVFVDVSLVHQAPHQMADGVLAHLPKNFTDRREIWDFLDSSRAMVLAVVGVPGSGKTTLLRHTAREVYRSRRGRRRPVPILLYLRDHVAAIVAEPSIAVPDLVRGSLGRYRSCEPPNWFEQRLHDGDCLVLLDGLDEVAKPKDRGAVAAWVERQTKQYPKNDFVVTSRPQGYRTASIEGAVVLQVRSFSRDQVVRLVRSWYLAVERHSTNAADQDVRMRAESAADNLLERLNGAPGLYDLTVNPLLLTMIANVHRYRGALPGSRANLYSEICQVMLWRRNEAKNLPSDLNGDKKEAILRGLAFVMMENRVRDLPQDQALTEIGPALRRMSRELSAKDFLADVSSNGMLMERESGLYSFAHLTFQEYLAAEHIRDKGLVNILAGSVEDIWWRETTLLYTAHADADPIVKACLESGTPAALSLAFECTEQEPELDPALHDRLNELFRVMRNDPEQHRQMTRVLLARTLRSRIQADTGSQICATPITAGIYKWYMQSTSSHGPDRSEINAEDPVTGVLGSDAVSFVRWVNTMMSGDPRYRLPTGKEIEDPAVRELITTSNPTIWVAGEGCAEHPELWTASHVGHPYDISSATLAVHVHDDIAQSKPALIRLLLFQAIDAAEMLADCHKSAQRDSSQISEFVGILKSLLEPAVDPGLDDALDRSFYRAVADDQNEDVALELAIDMTGMITTLTLEMADVLENLVLQKYERHLEMSLVRCIELGRELNGIRDLAFDQRQDTRLDRALGLRGTPDGQLTDAIGIALSRTLRVTLAEGAPSAEWNCRFSRSYLHHARLDDARWTLSLDEIEDNVRNSHSDFLKLLTNRNAIPDDWNYRTVGRMVDMALPIATRKQPISPEIAGAVRLMALCLAVEADARSSNSLGGCFRRIAAGMTLLERRANGQAPVTETIILATD